MPEFGVHNAERRTVQFKCFGCTHVLGGCDTFVSLPTGYGKPLCYTILPWAFDEIRNTDKVSIVLVVSLLVSVTTDEV